MMPMSQPRILVGIDVGSHQHRVSIAGPDGSLLDEFDCDHHILGFRDFFNRLARYEKCFEVPVAIAMEGFNGHARPLDTMIRTRGYTLFNVNNLKLARYKEIFPGPAKSDPIDSRKILELFYLKDHLPIAKDVLQEVAATPIENDKLKRVTRRRRQLVNERGRVVNRFQADLKAVSPGVLDITGSADNIWFLSLISSRDQLNKLAGMQRKSLLKIKGIGEKYADLICHWQQNSYFSPEVEWVSDMIIEDARRILEIGASIKKLEAQIKQISQNSEIYQLVQSIPGFGLISSAELAGEIGTIDRFESEASLALYLGMAALDNQSGRYHGTKTPRQVNKRAKMAMMTAVARHVEFVSLSNQYYLKKRIQGKKHNQAIRALGRHLVRVIWSMIKNKRVYEIRK